MKNRKLKRALTIATLVSFVLLGVYILATNLDESITFFYTPSELHKITTKEKIRIGGIVKPNSVKKNGIIVSFILTDCTKEIKVTYRGVLPSLFRAKQGIVALGMLDDAYSFQATQLLAKHDENYAPKGLEKSIPQDSLCRSIRYKS